MKRYQMKQEVHQVIKMDFEKRQNRIFVFAAVVSAGIAGAIFLYLHSPQSIPFLSCLVYDLTGFYCPGCGAGRACYSILHGEWYQAFRYNPLLVILLPWITLYLILWAGDWVWNKRHRIDRIVPFWFVFILLMIVIIFGIVRNIPIYPFTLLQPHKIL